MGVWDKVKGFFGRVWGGIKSGISKVGKFLTGTGSTIYNAVKPALNLIPGASAVTGVIDKALPAVGTALSSIGNS